jgi:hypothetical protein
MTAGQIIGLCLVIVGPILFIGYIFLSLLIADIKKKQTMEVIKNIIAADVKRQYRYMKLKDVKLNLGNLNIYISVESRDGIDLKEVITNDIGSKAKNYFQACDEHVSSIRVNFEETYIA